MSTFAAYTAKLLLLPMFMGSFCLGIFLPAPMVQAMAPDHEEMVSVSAEGHSMLATDAMPEGCCTVSHMDHDADVIATNVGKASVDSHMATSSVFSLPNISSSLSPQIFARSDQYPNRATFLTGIIIKRE